jgi:hypothetical protein
MNRSAISKILLAPAALIMGVALAGPVEEADAAYNKGDYSGALETTKIQATKGIVTAQKRLAEIYANGLGVPKDYVESAKWYRLAAEQGDAIAQMQIGFSYAIGVGVPLDYVEAIKWLRRSAKQGESQAQTYLGTLYSFGHGVPTNKLRAYMWFNLAAAQGSDAASDFRDSLANQITPEQVLLAQKMARECLKSKYQNCD